MKTQSILANVHDLIKEHRRLSYHGAGAATSRRLMEIGDNLCRELKIADSLSELAAQALIGYIPTIRIDQGPAHIALADLYDYLQECRGERARCVRGSLN